ncbi:protein turtle-like [Clarias gariepinus]|uniref:protein turtle-like n=1 Tax=Clarias gariepinus TaxID=13013 RepID=UPI00234D2633|nr:protein turtle-like [Clarias gariepinus]
MILKGEVPYALVRVLDLFSQALLSLNFMLPHLIRQLIHLLGKSTFQRLQSNLQLIKAGRQHHGDKTLVVFNVDGRRRRQLIIGEWWFYPIVIVQILVVHPRTFTLCVKIKAAKGVNELLDVLPACHERTCSEVMSYRPFLSSCIGLVKPKPTVRVNPQSSIYTGDTVTLTCELQESSRWEFLWYKNNQQLQSLSTERTSNNTLHATVNNAGETKYCCVARRYNTWTRTYYDTEYSNQVQITARDGDVILESPVHPVTEGHPLTLRCLYQNRNSSNLPADFYKDESFLQTQTTGEMIIHKVSKSDEGFYHCKHPERGESPKCWVSVRCVEAPFSVLMLISHVVTASPYLLVTIILLVKCYRARAHSDKEKSGNAVIEE